MPWLLDSDTLSLLARGHASVCQRVNQTPDSELFVAVVSAEELLRGRLAKTRSAKNDAELERAYGHLQGTLEFLRAVQIHPLSGGAIGRYNQLREQFRRRGTNDLRIAGIALEHNCVLVTRNTRDFADFPGLVVENWAR